MVKMENSFINIAISLGYINNGKLLLAKQIFNKTKDDPIHICSEEFVKHGLLTQEQVTKIENIRLERNPESYIHDIFKKAKNAVRQTSKSSHKIITSTNLIKGQ